MLTLLEIAIEKLLTKLASVNMLERLDARLKAGPLTFPFARLEPHRVEVEKVLAAFLSVEEFVNAAESIPPS